YWGNSNIKKVSSHKPGDLIFFKGTYGETNHPSHIGIMINDTQFIHAANEKTGVIITNIYDPYWRSHILGYGRIIPESANKKPVYSIVTGGFLGMKRAKSEVENIKSKFGWNATIKPNKSDNKYSIVTGGFLGMKRAKSEVENIKSKFGWNATIKPNKSDNKYSIVTGGFLGMERAKSEVENIKSKFGWNATIKPNGDRPNDYKIVINGFVGEDEVATAKQRLYAETGWYMEYVPTGEYK
ncbi:C40 family peptidase, partial [Paraclostridium sordellii]